jgi:hypothetical protein
MAMSIQDLDAWVDGEPEQQSPTFHVVHKPPRKLKGVWRDKKMRADRSPMYLTDYRNERHIWLSPISLKQFKKITRKEVK